MKVFVLVHAVTAVGPVNRFKLVVYPRIQLHAARRLF